MPKKTSDPTTIQMPPRSCEAPAWGVSAIPAVEKAATPQYKAFPYEEIVVPSIPLSVK
ncbi:MAG: hypothetical protein ABFS46_06115 [Myxococcota bacterium]